METNETRPTVLRIGFAVVGEEADMLRRLAADRKMSPWKLVYAWMRQAIERETLESVGARTRPQPQ